MIDFNDVEVTFASKNDDELKQAERLFSVFNQTWLVTISGHIGLLLASWGVPLGWAVRNTIFKHFCGGQSLDDCLMTINSLKKFNIDVILDYGVEAKDSEVEFENTLQQIKKTIDAAATQSGQRIISIKLTGLGSMKLLELLDASQPLTASQIEEWERVKARMHYVCKYGKEKNVQLYIDAEESWIQDATDHLVTELMQTYNSTEAFVFNTFQLYRHDRLDFLSVSILHAKKNNYILGAKLVRGAYMEKERKRAEKLNYFSPINQSKMATDTHYNQAVESCIVHLENVAFCCATHNDFSINNCLDLMQKNNIPKNSKHITFSQLYGMSDNLTYVLAKEGYNVTKYLPFGPVEDVLPYLMRRAQENTAMSGMMGRELAMIKQEIKRRKHGK